MARGGASDFRNARAGFGVLDDPVAQRAAQSRSCAPAARRRAGRPRAGSARGRGVPPSARVRSGSTAHRCPRRAASAVRRDQRQPDERGRIVACDAVEQRRCRAIRTSRRPRNRRAARGRDTPRSPRRSSVAKRAGDVDQLAAGIGRSRASSSATPGVEDHRAPESCAQLRHRAYAVAGLPTGGPSQSATWSEPMTSASGSGRPRHGPSPPTGAAPLPRAPRREAASSSTSGAATTNGTRAASGARGDSGRSRRGPAARVRTVARIVFAGISLTVRLVWAIIHVFLGWPAPTAGTHAGQRRIQGLHRAWSSSQRPRNIRRLPSGARSWGARRHAGCRGLGASDDRVAPGAACVWPGALPARPTRRAARRSRYRSRREVPLACQRCLSAFALAGCAANGARAREERVRRRRAGRRRAAMKSLVADRPLDPAALVEDELLLTLPYAPMHDKARAGTKPASGKMSLRTECRR